MAVGEPNKNSGGRNSGQMDNAIRQSVSPGGRSINDGHTAPRGNQTVRSVTHTIAALLRPLLAISRHIRECIPLRTPLHIQLHTR